MATFGENVRRIRKEKGFTQAFVAQKSDIDQSTLSKIERSEIDPTLSIATAIAKTLGVSIDQLTGHSWLKGTADEIKNSTPSVEGEEIGRLYEEVAEIRDKIDDVLLRRKKDKSTDSNATEKEKPPKDPK